MVHPLQLGQAPWAIPQQVDPTCSPPVGPELLVKLVQGSKHRMSRVEQADMQMMTEVTIEWMKYMVDKKFPPLTPHHTQAFTVMMMARCFADHLSEVCRCVMTPASRTQWSADGSRVEWSADGSRVVSRRQ